MLPVFTVRLILPMVHFFATLEVLLYKLMTLGGVRASLAMPPTLPISDLGSGGQKHNSSIPLLAVLHLLASYFSPPTLYSCWPPYSIVQIFPLLPSLQATVRGSTTLRRPCPAALPRRSGLLLPRAAVWAAFPDG
jgi:hypothetical protein